MVNLEEHLNKIREVQKEILNCKKGTPHYKDLCRYFKKPCRERQIALRYMRKAGKL